MSGLIRDLIEAFATSLGKRTRSPRISADEEKRRREGATGAFREPCLADSPPLFTRPTSTKARANGFSLLEIVIALTVFVIAITGLFSALQQIGMNSAAFAQDREIQYGLEAILTEARHLPVSEMAFERVDETQGVRYTVTVEPANLANIEGEALGDLYLLRATADFDGMGGGGTQIEAAEIYVYQPEEQAR